MLILAGGGHGVPLKYTELERWTRVGYEGGRHPAREAVRLVTTRLTVQLSPYLHYRPEHVANNACAPQEAQAFVHATL
jgi:hypothetical protein